MRFTTSLPGLIEGRVIDVEPPFGPDVQAWLDDGTLVPAREDDPEIAVAPDALERAIVRRARRPLRRGARQKRTVSASAVTADAAP